MGITGLVRPHPGTPVGFCHLSTKGRSEQVKDMGAKTRAAAAAESLQSCPTLCDPMDCSPPGSSVPGICQARVLEWVAIAFSIVIGQVITNNSGQLFFFAKRKKGVGFSYSQKC